MRPGIDACSSVPLTSLLLAPYRIACALALPHSSDIDGAAGGGSIEKGLADRPELPQAIAAATTDVRAEHGVFWT